MTGFLFYGIRGLVASDAPIVNSISIDPGLDVSRFAPYTINADIDRLPQSSTATANITGINGDGRETWNYYANGDPGTENVSREMAYDASLDQWKSSSVYPDNIYPEMYFAPSSITWNNAPVETVLRRNNYQLFHFKNSFSVTGDMSFWIELNAYRRSPTNSADLQFYLVEQNHDISYFQDDWRAKSGVELVGTITKDTAFNHTHTENSSHHLVALSTNSDSTIGSKNLHIDNDFWIIAYSNSPNDARGWDFRYQPSSLCNNTNGWYSGSQSGWTTSAQSGCPDAHVHIARRSSTGGIRDGVMVTVSATSDGETGTKTQSIYYNELPNMRPNATNFSSPSIGGTYQGNIAISWARATDPNNDALKYDLKLLDSSGNQFGNSLLVGSENTNYTLQTNVSGQEIPNGDYGLWGQVCDQGDPESVPPGAPLCAEYTLDGLFTINNSDPIYSLSNIAIISNNSTPNLAKAGDRITLSFVSSGVLNSPSVIYYSGGGNIAHTPVLSNNGNSWTGYYDVNAEDTDGEISFVISGLNLDLDYHDTTNGSAVAVDTTAPIITSYSPSDNATGVAVDANLVATFSENVIAQLNKNIVIKKSVDSEIFETIPANDQKVGIENSVVTINPTTAFLEKTGYFVEITSESFADPAGNIFIGITGSEIWSFTIGDFTPPALESVTIRSSGENSEIAKKDDVVTLSILASEKIQTPAVTFKSGNVSVLNPAVLSNTIGDNWTASYIVDDSDLDGEVLFTVIYKDEANNEGQTVSETTNGSRVVVSKSIQPTNSTENNQNSNITENTETGTGSVSTENNQNSNTAESAETSTGSVTNESTRPSSGATEPSTELPKSSDANKYYNLSIKITENDIPVVGAKVELFSNVMSSVTDSEGIAKFFNVAEGTHKIVVTYNDKKIEKELVIDQNHNEDIPINVELNANITEKETKSYKEYYIIFLTIVIFLIILILINRKKLIKMFHKRTNASKKKT